VTKALIEAHTTHHKKEEAELRRQEEQIARLQARLAARRNSLGEQRIHTGTKEGEPDALVPTPFNMSENGLGSNFRPVSFGSSRFNSFNKALRTGRPLPCLNLTGNLIGRTDIERSRWIS